MRLIAALTLCLMLAACAEGPIGNPNVPAPAKAVDLTRYLGKWYEIGRYENRFEKGCEAVTAEYSLRDDGKIRVLNSCHTGTSDGPLKTAEGKAYSVENSDNAKLRVSFFGPFYGDYWVLDHANDYSWSIVGEPSGRYLWILTRTPTLSKKQISALVTRVSAMGYDTSLLYYPNHAH
jgi:apolipoprotein D and lipocalin family protein